MLIGELSKCCGLSRDTIRFYEKKGLIQPGRKENPYNDYKNYTAETLNRLLMIKKIKQLGFTLNETANILEMIELNAASCHSISEKMSEKVALLDRKIKELEELKLLMKNGLSKCQTCCPPLNENENCPVLVSDLLQ